MIGLFLLHTAIVLEVLIKIILAVILTVITVGFVWACIDTDWFKESDIVRWMDGRS